MREIEKMQKTCKKGMNETRMEAYSEIYRLMTDICDWIVKQVETLTMKDYELLKNMVPHPQFREPCILSVLNQEFGINSGNIGSIKSSATEIYSHHKEIDEEQKKQENNIPIVSKNNDFYKIIPKMDARALKCVEYVAQVCLPLVFDNKDDFFV